MFPNETVMLFFFTFPAVLNHADQIRHLTRKSAGKSNRTFTGFRNARHSVQKLLKDCTLK